MAESFDSLARAYKLLITIRTCEEYLANGREKGLIRGPVHLGIGQEAVAVGVSASLTNTDYVFGNHRSHSHLLALDPDPFRLFSEVLARATGYSFGSGGSMHLTAPSKGFHGSVPIVAATIPLAVGAALRNKLLNSPDISVAYFGDGATEEGIFHESLNLASTLSLPVLFVLENNFYSSHLHITQRQPARPLTRYAEAHDVKSFCVNGNDYLNVKDISSRIISEMRSSPQPFLLECQTYRWLGHVDWRSDIDVGITRSAYELAQWKSRDCIHHLKYFIQSCWPDSDSTLRSIQSEVLSSVQDAWNKALDSPPPDPSTILAHTYYQS